jgi:hypothetical protein
MPDTPSYQDYEDSPPSYAQTCETTDSNESFSEQTLLLLDPLALLGPPDAPVVPTAIVRSFDLTFVTCQEHSTDISKLLHRRIDEINASRISTAISCRLSFLITEEVMIHCPGLSHRCFIAITNDYDLPSFAEKLTPYSCRITRTESPDNTSPRCTVFRRPPGPRVLDHTSCSETRMKITLKFERTEEYIQPPRENDKIIIFDITTKDESHIDLPNAYAVFKSCTPKHQQHNNEDNLNTPFRRGTPVPYRRRLAN